LIFLAVGNWHKGFDRLVKAVDDLIGSGVITDGVTAQTGYGSYKPKHMTVMNFCSPDEFKNLISKAELVVSHAGVGTIAQAIKESKPIVVVPRKASLGEHFDDHQFATAEALEKEHKVLVAYEVSELPNKLQQVKDFVPAKGKGCQKISNAIEMFLQKLEAKKCNRTNNE